MNVTILAVVGVFGLFACLVMALRSLFRKSIDDDEHKLLVTEAPISAVMDMIPRCVVCGKTATEQMPYLRRGRGIFSLFTFIRQLFAAPPLIRRHIDTKMQPELCRVHAHVADARMDEFLHVRVRGILATANAQIAAEAAGFEREGMLKYLNDSLTDSEKKSMRKTPTNNVVSLVANGDNRESAN